MIDLYLPLCSGSSSITEWPKTIIAIFAPAHCPELISIEWLRQLLKQLWKNENFAALDALRAGVNQKLERLSVQQVHSLTAFDLTVDVQLQAAF